ncbi:MAG: hypothetical protein ACQERB_00075 [Promethearchaeati archaeon]
MTSKKYLSTKKTSQQCISISPALKDWINRYVNKMKNEHPEDERYKSISAFYTQVMEKTLNAFERGKTLDDFEKFVDEEVNSFYDKFSFKATIPFYEMILETNKYTELDYEGTLSFFSAMKIFFKDYFTEKDVNKLEIFIKRLENYFRENNLSSHLNFEVITQNDSIYPKFRVEVTSLYKNLIYENAKFVSAIFGLLGIKLTSFIHSPKNSYYRIEAEGIELMFEENVSREELRKLIDYNIQFFINYTGVLKDHDYYLWMKMASDKDVSIDFEDDFARHRWIKLIEENIEKYGNMENRLLNFLRFFEKLHWIEIENEQELIFRIRLNPSKQEQREFFLEYLSNYVKVKEYNGKYYLK